MRISDWSSDVCSSDLRDLSKDNLGLPAALLPVDYAVPTTASVYVLRWNTGKVTDAQAPKTWDEVINDKWAGHVGSWVRAAAFAQLASVWGEDKAKASLENFVKQIGRASCREKVCQYV